MFQACSQSINPQRCGFMVWGVGGLGAIYAVFGGIKAIAAADLNKRYWSYYRRPAGDWFCPCLCPVMVIFGAV